MIVVSDTTAVTSLLKIGYTSLLPSLFKEVIIPEAVHTELLNYHSEIPAFLQVRAVRNKARVARLLKDLDQGEAEAIILAKELSADALLIDEKRGRSIAEQDGIRCIGLAGAMLMAKHAKLIPNLKELLNLLEQRANFYLVSDLKEQLLRHAGE